MDASVMREGTRFESIDAAKEAISQYVLNNGESFRTVKSDQKRFVICCKDEDCGFWIRAAKNSKEVVSITRFKPHSCSPAIHYNNPRSQSVRYFMEHHRAAIIDNWKITAAQIRLNKHLQFSNTISYLQAYCTIQAVLTKMHSDKAESFVKFPAFGERFEAADLDNFCRFAIHVATGHFQAAFFAPAGLRHAQKKLQPFIGIDGTHTGSRFRITLLIAGGIDANEEILPLAWALVLIESEAWWKRFFKCFKLAFCNAQHRGFIFMSDREKGLPDALKAVFPEAVQAYCC